MCENEYSNCVQTKSKTHLIFSAAAYWKTTLFFKILIQEKLNRNEDVFVFGHEVLEKVYFSDISNNKFQYHSPKDVSSFSNKTAPKDIAEYIVNSCYSLAGKDNIITIAIDGFEQFKLNPDYSLSEYFRELSKKCRTNDINLLYILHSDTHDENEAVYYKLPKIYERFSDNITVLK